MRPSQLSTHLRDFSERRLQELANAQASKLQALYDQVLRDGAGKTVDEVKALLSTAWRMTFNRELAEPDLTQRSEVLAAGRRIVVDPQIKR